MVWVFLVWKGCLEGMNNVGTNYQSDFGKGSLNSIGQQMLQYHHYQPIKQPPYNTTIINQSNNHLTIPPLSTNQTTTLQYHHYQPIKQPPLTSNN
jgi:hypothetical protein